MNTSELPPQRIARPVPAWVAPGFAALAIVMVPWIAYLTITLPAAARTYERGPWVGYDIGLMLALTMTAVLAWRGSARVAFAAAVTSTLLVIDSWFDISTSIGDAATASASAMSIVEIGLAAICGWIAYHADLMVRTNVRGILRRARRRGRDAHAGTTTTAKATDR